MAVAWRTTQLVIAVKVVSSPQQSHADMKVGKMKLMGCQVCKGQIEDPLSLSWE
jgi:hypothetical protein